MLYLYYTAAGDGRPAGAGLSPGGPGPLPRPHGPAAPQGACICGVMYINIYEQSHTSMHHTDQFHTYYVSSIYHTY